MAQDLQGNNDDWSEALDIINHKQFFDNNFSLTNYLDSKYFKN